MKRGFFVVVEGIDGVGKTAQVGLLTAALRARGHDAMSVADGRRGPWGRAARLWMRGQPDARMHPDQVAALSDPRWPIDAFCRDRYELAYSVIAPAVNAGKIVVCDRWVHSTWAYGRASGVSEAHLEQWIGYFRPPVLPDLVFWLQVRPEQALERIDHAAVAGLRPEIRQRYESPAFLRSVLTQYAVLAADHDMVPIDGDRALAAVTGDLEQRVLQLVFDVRALEVPVVPAPGIDPELDRRVEAHRERLGIKPRDDGR